MTAGRTADPAAYGRAYPEPRSTRHRKQAEQPLHARADESDDPGMTTARAAARALFRARGPQDVTEPHETRASAVLRPVVFGANDGLVSNLALVTGVAGANAEPAFIVLAGIAGLLAGAFSMGVGEYISVQSQRELLEYQFAFQRRQLVEAPEQERRILVEAYVDRGLTRDE